MRLSTYPANAGKRLCVVVTTALLLIGLVLARPLLPAATAESGPGLARSPVVVSLTYDDGSADHLQAGELMARHGLKGTFYVNSSLLGAPGRLRVADALALQSAGNEIGGHTVTHADLPTISPDEQQRQICGDRTTLLGHGLRAADFAYPYGDDSAAVREVVRTCGYNSGRVVGGLASPGSCAGCPPAERIPPANLYSIATPDSVKPHTSVEELQNQVLQAEEHGGGWVVFVMHRICDGCDPYAAAPGVLDPFFAWPATRGPAGTVVKTVGEANDGTVHPAVPGLPPEPSP